MARAARRLHVSIEVDEPLGQGLARLKGLGIMARADQVDRVLPAAQGLQVVGHGQRGRSGPEEGAALLTTPVHA